MTAPAYTQTRFRIRNDDGSESAATWRQAEDTNDNVPKDTNFRVRIKVDETNVKSWAGVTWNLYYSKNGAAYAAVTGSTPVKFALSDNFVDGDDCTEQLTLDTGTFTTDNNGMKETTGGATNTGAGNGANFETEWCLQLDSAQMATNDYVDLRIYNGTTALNVYTAVPRITAIVSAQTASITEPMTLADSPSASQSRAASQTEALSLAETQSTAGSIFGVTQSESLALADSPDGLRSTASSITEPLTLDDSVQASTVYNVDITEGMSLAETQDAVKVTVYTADITEALSLQDSQDAPGSIYNSSITESLSLADIIDADMAGAKTAEITEPLTLADSSDGLRISGSSISESMSLGDTQDAIRITTADLTESLSLSDSGNSSRITSALITETMTLLDNILGSGAYSTDIIELITLSDETTAMVGWPDLPASRSISIRAENRTMVIGFENRTSEVTDAG